MCTVLHIHHHFGKQFIFFSILLLLLYLEFYPNIGLVLLVHIPVLGVRAVDMLVRDLINKMNI